MLAHRTRRWLTETRGLPGVRRGFRRIFLASLAVHAVAFGLLWGSQSSAPALGGVRADVAWGATLLCQEAVPAPPPETLPLEEAVADLDAVDARPPEAEVPEELPELAAEAAPTPDPVRDLTPPDPRARTKPARTVAAAQPAPVPPPSVPIAATAPAAPPRPAVAASAGGAVLNPSPRADNRPPRYPAESLERGERGAVVLRIRVSEAGQVVEVLVERSSGYPLLDAAAVEAAYAWRYAPARMDGAPVSALVRQTVRFERQA